MQLNPKTIKELRQQFNWTQQQLADACDVSLRTVQRVEKEGAASKETTMALCAVFEVRQGELIKLDNLEVDETVKAQSAQKFIIAIAVSSLISFTLGVSCMLLITSLFYQ